MEIIPPLWRNTVYHIWKYSIRCQSEKYIINCDIKWHKKNLFKQNLLIDGQNVKVRFYKKNL